MPTQAQTHQQNFAPAAGGGAGSWYNLYSVTLATNNPGWAQYTMRQGVATAAYDAGAPSTATQIRVTMTAASTTGVNFMHAWIGHAAASGDVIDFDGTQVQLLFSGGSGGIIAAAGTLVSDAKTYSFNKTKPLVISVHFVDAPPDSDVKSTTPLTNFTGGWALDGSHLLADDTDVTVGGGGGFDIASRLYLFSKVEVFGGGSGGGGGGAYSGPGDIVTGAVAWWGLRAYSSSQLTGTTKAIRIVKTSDGSAAQDINILPDGTLDVATIAALGYGVSVTTLYDQTGNGFNLTQATLSRMPVLSLNQIGTKPAINFSNSIEQYFVGSGIPGTVNSTRWVSYVAKRVNQLTSFCTLLKTNGGGLSIGFAAATDSLYVYHGTMLTFSNIPKTADLAFHAVQVLNDFGVASSIYSDGLSSGALGNPGSTGESGNIQIGGDESSGSHLPGSICELGMWTGNKTASNGAMNSNQRVYWGF